jgi:hypothetical protein
LEKKVADLKKTDIEQTGCCIWIQHKKLRLVKFFRIESKKNLNVFLKKQVTRRPLGLA